ncbi:MAG: MoxR family ATPase, partial [Oscillospiraceae bacterium]|nr:MoxR family ATPase [Oscillospiraceae bacterium]
GVGKTTLALALAKSVNLTFGRIQFTPDTLPGDIVGYTTVDMRTGEMKFHTGPVMNHIVLADEINRTSPKTQASLLEVMEEQQITAEGRTMPVPKPFMVIATENPIDFTGTYNLPEAQLDRFLMRISMGYPKPDEEKEMLRTHLCGERRNQLSPVVTQEEILSMQQEVSEVTVSDAIRNYIVEIVTATRQSDRLTLGASPRASLALAHAAQAWAYLQGRNYVNPEDIQAVVYAVLTHRLVVSLDASLRKATAEDILKECMNQISVPPVTGKKV